MSLYYVCKNVTHFSKCHKAIKTQHLCYDCRTVNSSTPIFGYHSTSIINMYRECLRVINELEKVNIFRPSSDAHKETLEDRQRQREWRKKKKKFTILLVLKFQNLINDVFWWLADLEKHHETTQKPFVTNWPTRGPHTNACGSNQLKIGGKKNAQKTKSLRKSQSVHDFD